MSKLILIVVLLTIGSRLLGAQALPNAGAKVRVSSGAGATFVGTLAEWRPDSIVISDSTGRRAFAAHRNTRVEVSRGTRRATLKGAAIGAGLGLIAGYLVGSSSSDATGAWAELESMSAGMSMSLMMGAGGLLVGGIVGSTLDEERWQRTRP